MTTIKAASAPGRLCDFLRSRREIIITDWTRRMRALSPARDISEAAVVDHFPKILARIADIVESVHTGAASSLEEFPKDHALDRLARGFDLDQIVTEYGLLRRSILDLWESSAGPVIDLSELRMLDAAFDESLRQSAVKYAQAREKLLKGLDRVSEAALGPGDLTAFLNDLLRATLEGTESAHTAVVLIREGDLLRVRAAVGLEEDLNRTFAIRVGEGFAGEVASEGRPLFVRHAATDPRIQSQAIKQKGVRALYGVPMVRAGEVLGVAHIGSLTTFEFSDEDKLLFRTMVTRATSVLIKEQLAANLRSTEAAQRFLSEVSKEFSQSLDYEATLNKIGRLAVPTIADWCVVDVFEENVTRRVSVVHSDPDKGRRALELYRSQQRYGADPDWPPGIGTALRYGRPECVGEMTDSQLATEVRDPEQLKVMRELGFHSYLVVPLLFHDQVLGAVALVLGESNRRYSSADLQVAEELARRAATAIENARLYRQAQEAVQLRERVLAIVSHDLRNQLHVISSSTSLLSKQPFTSPEEVTIRRTIERLQRSASSMQHLVGDLLDMGSIQVGRLSVERRPVPLEPVLQEACEAHEAMARARGLRLECEFAINRIEIFCDRDRILQVLTNLLGNAIKFSEAGHSVLLRAEVRDHDVLVAVNDTGPGIPRDEFQSIFEPYHTVVGQRKSGTGLGLYVARCIVERHGGRIWVDSELQVGTTFFFTLPRT